MKNKLTGCLLIVLILAGCSSVEEVKKPAARMRGDKTPPADAPAEEERMSPLDGPPSDDIDVTHLQNAIPRIEPLSRYGNPAVYEVFGKRYKVMDKSHGYTAKGVASWYGKKFHGQRTSSGEPFDMFGMTAAHRSLPIPTYAKVKNLKNGKEIIVKVNDRGPFVGDRLIDLSYAAAKKLGFHDAGTAPVHITAIDPIAWQKENGRKLYLQIGAFNKKLRAEDIAQQASSVIAKSTMPLKVHVLPDIVANQALYKVRIGPLENKAEAEKLQKKWLAVNSHSKTTLVYD